MTTLDIDFMFRKTPANLKKLKAVAQNLRAVILKPYYPVSDLFRVINDEQGLQLDFMSRLHGIRSFEGLRSRAMPVEFGEHELMIASLADCIKPAMASPVLRGQLAAAATWPSWKSFKKRSMNKKTKKAKVDQLAALKGESERALVEQIRRLLALPMNKRTHFLRVRHPSGGSHL